MSKYGYIGKDGPTQTINDNTGLLSLEEHKDLILDEKLLILGQLDLIQTQTVSGVTTVDFTSLGSYNIHFLTNHNLESSTTNVRWGVRLYESGVLETGSVYEWAYSQQLDSGSTSDFNSSSHSSLPIQLEQPTSLQGNAYTYFYNLIDSSKYSHISNHHNRSTGGIIAEFGMGVMKQASTVTGFQISAYDTSSAAFSGTFSLYGMKDY
tara:strand:- start:775 stop:1398 length:624 start_codon:yes stop_codon:yes gene_type:complete